MAVATKRQSISASASPKIVFPPMDGAAPVLLTATGFAAKQAIAFLRKHNVEPAIIAMRGAVRARLCAGNGNPLSHRVSAVAQAKLLEYAAEAMCDSAFGLHLAAQTDPKDAGIFFYVASGASFPGFAGEAVAV